MVNGKLKERMEANRKARMEKKQTKELKKAGVSGYDDPSLGLAPGMIPNKKTGGMINSNAKVKALTKAGSKGVKSGVNTKASASKVAKGKVGGISKAPKTAIPKAKYGMAMKGKKSC